VTSSSAIAERPRCRVNARKQPDYLMLPAPTYVAEAYDVYA